MVGDEKFRKLCDSNSKSKRYHLRIRLKRNHTNQCSDWNLISSNGRDGDSVGKVYKVGKSG